MAMLEKHRNALYNHFAPQLGEEVTQALMANFPSRDVEEPVTKADMALVRADLALVRADLDVAIADLRTEIADVKTEVHKEFGAVRVEIADIKTELQHALNRQLVYLSGVIAVAVGVLLRAG